MECYNILYSSELDLLPYRDKVQSYPSDQVLIQVFTGTKNRHLLQKAIDTINALIPDASIIGASTEGEIFASEITDQKIVVSISLFDSTKVTAFCVHDAEVPSGIELGKLIASHQPTLAILFTTGIVDGNLRNSVDYLQDISEQAPGVMIAGGQAGIGEAFTQTFVFDREQVLTHGTAVALLTGPDLNVSTYRRDGWTPIGRYMTVTKCKGNRVYTIDNRSVRDVYSHYLGVDFDFSQLHNPTLEFPLTYYIDGIMMKNVPIKEYDDGSFEFLKPFRANESVRFSFCDISLLEMEALSIQRQLQEIEPQAIYIYSCASRKEIFGNEIIIDSQELNQIASCSGFFTSSEFYTSAKDDPQCLIQNMTLLALSEKQSTYEQPDYEHHQEVEEFELTRTFRVLKILTNLITVTSRELEESHQKLAKIVNQDSTTKLFTRRYFDTTFSQSLKIHSRASTPISLLLLDIDFFKQFNDCYGHVAGDECLAAIGKVLKLTLKRPSDIAFRYGGEEMGCLLPATSIDGAMEIAEHVREAIESLHIEHQSSKVSRYVTASVGVISLRFTEHESLPPHNKRVIDACDEMLYQAKAQGRNTICGREVLLDDLLTDEE